MVLVELPMPVHSSDQSLQHGGRRLDLVLNSRRVIDLRRHLKKVQEPHQVEVERLIVKRVELTRHLG